MSPDDFLARCRIYRRYQTFMSVLYKVAFAAAIIMGWWLERQGGCASGTCALAVVLTALFIGSVMFYTLMRGPQKHAKALGLTCPSCGKSLLGSGAQPGLVTGHCAFCRAKVLDS
jgi:hypothetical protein